MVYVRAAAVAALLSIPTPATPGPPVVEGATARCDGERCTVSVTIRHADEGWDHYANGWTVLAPSGEELGHRVLHHPHVEEQPFTRSLTLDVPSGIERLAIVPHDSVHGDGAAFEVRIEGR